MFSILWRFLPGPVWVRLVLILAVLAAVVYALAFYGYPWVATLMPEEETTITS